MTEAQLRAQDITVTFGDWVNRFDAVHEASLQVSAGQAIGIVGESGSGKTTLARVMVGLQKPTRGSVVFEGARCFAAGREAMFPRCDRWKIQMVFQDPYSSLNPRLRAWQTVAEALQVWKKLSPRQARDGALEALNAVGVTHEQALQFPRYLSGGQRQRVSVARALAPEPRILIADEPTSSIDQSAQAQLLNLLRHLQEDHGLTIVFISHDLGVIRYLTSEVYVMQKGIIVESGPTLKVFERPEHPYTQLLISSIPGRRADTTVAASLRDGAASPGPSRDPAPDAQRSANGKVDHHEHR